MPRPEVADAVRATCESILNAHGVELVTFSLGGESVGQVLGLPVDRVERAVSLDEIVEISEEISRTLDAEDPIPGRYTLEVASAGIEGPLVRPTDYRRFEGQRVYTGTIRSAGDESFVLAVAERQEVVEIPYVGVSKARLVVDWDRELKGTRGGL